MRLLIALVTAAFGCLAAPVSAQRYWGPDKIPYCSRETAADVCRAQSLELLLTKLQMPDAQRLVDDGFKGIRVFQYDAFGTIWPTSFILTKPVGEYRREGTAQGRTIHADGHLATLERPIWENGWNEMDAVVQSLLEHPPTEFTVQPVLDGDLPILPTCLDAPVVIIEVIADGQVNRWWPNACTSDAATAKAQQIAQIIAAAFPVCGHFGIERYGRGLGRLRACLSVDGEDAVSASEVMEILRPNIGGDTRVIYEAKYLSENVSLTGIDGRQVVGRSEVQKALEGGALGDRWLRVLRATGDMTGVTVVGQLIRTRDNNNPNPLPLRVRWTRKADGGWHINDWSVEPR